LVRREGSREREGGREDYIYIYIFNIIYLVVDAGGVDRGELLQVLIPLLDQGDLEGGREGGREGES